LDSRDVKRKTENEEKQQSPAMPGFAASRGH
jgi:hypothetical protein